MLTIQMDMDRALGATWVYPMTAYKVGTEAVVLDASKLVRVGPLPEMDALVLAYQLNLQRKESQRARYMGISKFTQD